MHLHELHQLSLLIVEIGDGFMVRRTMQRLEAKELILHEAIALLRSLGGHHITQDVLSTRISR